MILKDTLYDGIFWFCIVVGILLIMFFGHKSFCDEANKDLKNIASNLGASAILSAICAFLLFWSLNFLVNMIVSCGAIEIKEIVFEDDIYSIVEKYYFDKSKIPTGNDIKVLDEAKGTHYYNSTNKEIVYFSRKYYSELSLKWQQRFKEMREDKAEKPFDLLHMNDSRVEYDTISGVIINPRSFFNMTKTVDCAFKPSPTSIIVTRSKRSKYKAFDSDSITIMDVKDSLINHHWVVIKNTR